MHCRAQRSPGVMGVAWAAGRRSIHISVDSAVPSVGRASSRLEVKEMERRTTEPLKPGPRGPVAPANLERSGGFVRWWVCAEWRAPGSCAVPDSPDRTSMSLPLLAARCLVSVLSAAHWLPMSAHGPPTGHGPGPSWVHPSHGHRLGLKGRLGEAPPGGVPGYCTGAKEDLMEHDRAKNPPVLFLLLHRHHVRDSRPFRRRPPTRDTKIIIIFLEARREAAKRAVDSKSH